MERVPSVSVLFQQPKFVYAVDLSPRTLRARHTKSNLFKDIIR